MAITLNDDGTATVDGITLRVPTLKEYADLVDRSSNELTAARDLIARRDELRKRLDADADSDEIRRDLLAVKHDLDRLSSTVLATALLLLADDQKAAEAFVADPPAWTSDLSAFLRLQAHWETAPFPGSEPSM